MKNKKLILACALLLINVNAFATYTCVGEVEGVTLNPKTGEVSAEKLAGLTWPVLCSVNAEVNLVPVESCKSLLSLLLTAQVSGKKVTLWFNDDSSGGSCTSHASWTYLSGWYFGPKLHK